jgi:hypothetical protein
MRRLAWIGLVLVGSAAAAPLWGADGGLDGQPTHKNGISLRLPLEWKSVAQDAGHLLLAAEAPTMDTDTTGDYAPRITVTSAAGSVIDGPGQQKQLAQEIPSYEATEPPQNVTINGMKGITFGGTFTAGALKLRSRQYLLIHADRLYTLTILSLASTWEQHIGVAAGSIQTFTITQK